MQQKFRLQIFVYLFAWKSGLITVYLSTPLTVKSWWSQCVVMAVHHCYSWWRWWLDTLWVTLTRSWPHSLSCYLQVLCRFLFNLIDMYLWCFYQWSIWLIHTCRLYYQTVWSKCPDTFDIFPCSTGTIWQGVWRPGGKSQACKCDGGFTTS